MAYTHNRNSSMKSIEVIIETPKGSHFKYKYDPSTKNYGVHKALPEGLTFPYDFGFIPQSKGEDGDPLDVLIFSEYSFLHKSVLSCKILGAIKAEQSKDKTKKQKMIRNDRILVSPELSGFVSPYNALQDIIFKPLGILSANEAKEIIKQQLT